MASTECRFPPQKQDTQPGQEYPINPPPQYNSRVQLVFIRGCYCDFHLREGARGQGRECTLEAKAEDAKDPLAIPVDDLGYEENCKRVVDEVIKAYGRIDILVNNAAVPYQSDSLDDIDDQRLEMVFRANIFSYYFMTK